MVGITIITFVDIPLIHYNYHRILTCPRLIWLFSVFFLRERECE